LDSIREEFTLPTAAELEVHFQAQGDTEAMRRSVRVFIGEGTFCPGFQLKDGLFHQPVLDLFQHGMALKIPHNVFAAWMVSPLPGESGFGCAPWTSWATYGTFRTRCWRSLTVTVRSKSAARAGAGRSKSLPAAVPGPAESEVPEGSVQIAGTPASAACCFADNGGKVIVGLVGDAGRFRHPANPHVDRNPRGDSSQNVEVVEGFRSNVPYGP
jgi:hypothetical protein